MTKILNRVILLQLMQVMLFMIFMQLTHASWFIVIIDCPYLQITAGNSHYSRRMTLPPLNQWHHPTPHSPTTPSFWNRQQLQAVLFDFSHSMSSFCLLQRLCSNEAPQLCHSHNTGRKATNTQSDIVQLRLRDRQERWLSSASSATNWPPYETSFWMERSP